MHATRDARPKSARGTAGSRVVAALVLVAAATLGAVLAGAAPASAHNVLRSTRPADGATVDTTPTTVTLTFSARVTQLVRVAVTGPDGKAVTTGPPRPAGTTVTQSLTPGPAGRYTVAYRVISPDGHPVTGTVTFTATTAAAAPTSPAPGSPAPTASPSPTPAGSDGPSPRPAAAGSADGGPGPWTWIVGSAVLAVFALGVTMLAGRRRSRPART